MEEFLLFENPTDENLEIIKKSKDCDFERWLESQETNAYHQTKIFVDLKNSHNKYHESLGTISKYLLNNDMHSAINSLRNGNIKKNLDLFLLDLMDFLSRLKQERDQIQAAKKPKE